MKSMSIVGRHVGGIVRIGAVGLFVVVRVAVAIQVVGIAAAPADGSIHEDRVQADVAHPNVAGQRTAVGRPRHPTAERQHC